MRIPKSSIKFITNLHKLISEEEKKYDKSVNWIEKEGKKGFNILNLREFHERCILNLITLSYDHRSLFRQLNNYGFKQIKEFWYHSDNLFFKESKDLKSIKRCSTKKIKKENKITQTNSLPLSKKRKRKVDSNHNSSNKKENKATQTDSYHNIDIYKNNNYDIIRHTEDFLANEKFHRIDFDEYIEEDFLSCFSFLEGIY